MPLGHAPRPTDGARLAERIRDVLAAAGATGMAGDAVEAELDGADVVRLAVDLTGAAFVKPRGGAPDRLELQGVPVSSEPGVLGELVVHAEPILIGDAPVSFHVRLLDVGLRWVETDAGELGIDLDEPSDDRPVRGHAIVSVPKHRLSAMALTLADAFLADAGVAVSHLELDVEGDGRQGLRLVLNGKMRKGLLSASVRGSATATIDDLLGLTLSGIHLESGNPLVAAMLVAARGRIQVYEGHRFDLREVLPPGFRLDDVRLEVTDSVTLEARLA